MLTHVGDFRSQKWVSKKGRKNTIFRILSSPGLGGDLVGLGGPVNRLTDTDNRLTGTESRSADQQTAIAEQ